MRRGSLSSTLLLVAVCGVTATTAASGLRRNAVVEAVEAVGPAVANIATESLVRRDQLAPGAVDPSVEEYFRDFYEPSYHDQPHVTSLGSAVLIDSRGYLLTNEHVVLRAERIKVILADQRTFEAELIGTDPDSDLALLKIDAPGRLPSVPLGNSADLMIGETVIAIGNPFGLSQTVTTGVVSARHRSVKAGNRSFSDFIQTDASINPGNSGGPLLNIDGELIGINTAIYGEGRGIGFAIPIDRARRVLEDLMRYGSVYPAWIGVEVKPVVAGLAADLDLPAGTGVVVTHTYRHGPAAKAGLRPGDVLVALQGKTLHGAEDLDTFLSHHSAGDRLELVLVRDRKRRKLSVRALKSDSPAIERIAEDVTGMRLAEGPGGLVVAAVTSGGRAAAHGLEVGDAVVELNGTRLESLATWRKAFQHALGARSLLLLVRRQDVGAYVPFKVR